MKRNNAARLSVGLAVAVLIAAVVHVLIEATFSPWARSLSGSPVLTGEWIGDFETQTGARHLVWLEIVHSMPTTYCDDCPEIDGRIDTCSHDEKAKRYEIWGGVEGRRGPRFHLKTREVDGTDGDLRLGMLEGVWEAETLRLTTTLKIPGEPITTHWERSEDGVETMTTVGGNPDTRKPITFSMRRGSFEDFESLCASSD